MKITYQVTITLASGATAVHVAELLGVRHTADGASAATAACCGKIGALLTCSACGGSGCQTCGGSGSIKDEDTRSNHAFYDIANMTDADILAELQVHVERVANHHAGAHKAREFIASLTAPDPAPNPAPSPTTGTSPS
jgi:hypothetical protein